MGHDLSKGSASAALRPLEAWEIDLVTGGRSSNDNAIIYVGGDDSWNSGDNALDAQATAASGGYGDDGCNCNCDGGYGGGYGDDPYNPCYDPEYDESTDWTDDEGNSLKIDTQFNKQTGDGKFNLTASNGWGSGSLTIPFKGFDLSSVNISRAQLNFGSTSFSADFDKNRLGVSQSFNLGGGQSLSATLSRDSFGSGFLVTFTKR